MSTSTEAILETVVSDDGSASRSAPSDIRKQPPTSSRYVMVLHCFLSFVVCNIDRINLSVAIIPMAKTFAWSESTKGLVQSVFFLGYMTTQIAGGMLADRRGGRPVLAAGVLAWSVATMITPLAAHFALPVLLIARVVLGVGEGVAMPAMNAIIAAWVPVQERARSLSFVYSGMYVGSILGLLFSPLVMQAGGWPAVFYVFGAVGVVWVALFWFTTSPAPRCVKHGLRAGAKYEMLPTGPVEEGTLAVESRGEAPALGSPSPSGSPPDGIDICKGGDDFSGQLSQTSAPPPTLREMLSRKCVWAIIIAHFCCTWGYFVLLTWLPSYLNSRFDLDVRSSAFLAATPWVSMFVCANLGGLLADGLIARAWSVTRTRKLMQTVGFAGPAAFLAALCTARHAGVAMAYVSAALGLAAFSQSGVYANHQDIGPGVAGTLLGISNTFASIPGVIGVYVSGVVLDATGHDWNAVFGMAIAFYIVGLVVYNLFATSERQW